MSHLARTLASTLAAFAVVGALVGCAPSSEPTPTPTGFASEAEAFEAAEATYRAYVDALNEVDLSDPETFEPVFALTTGAANSGARETFSGYHANGWQVEGTTVATLVEADNSTLASDESLTLAICLDVSDVRVVDTDGESVVSDDRPPVQPMSVRLVFDERNWLISEIDGREGLPACD